MGLEPHFQRVVIHGVGLLGGSLGMALRGRGLARVVTGLGRSAERLAQARDLGALDDFSTDPAEALRGADAFISCLPPREIRTNWKSLSTHLARGAFVTDVGSVKAGIVREAGAALPDGIGFIGSHPMAGSEKSGAEAARPDLFEGACCFLTPTEATAPATLRRAAEFWKALGCRIVIASPERHDRLMAATSHLPHLVAAALVDRLHAGGDATLFHRFILGNGFRDTTRVAAGPADVWEQIFSDNRDALGIELDGLIEELRTFREQLRAGGDELKSRLDRASVRRKELDRTRGPEDERRTTNGG